MDNVLKQNLEPFANPLLRLQINVLLGFQDNTSKACCRA